MTPAARRPHFWRDISILLVAKLVMLTCLYFLFFGPSHRPLADSAAVSAQILGSNQR
ncbi:MAG: phosphoglycerate mutase [Alphaproteobacteria bacterium]|nr:phosphoglycerate mutase [Alphaproteobacteria bacterium]MDE2164205.1 phosphoglycerate mutase [Alphaproteobacteria bacterium]MDE2264292.1 phosphoglycerate mutase [Alphaproteobacteria bacterium]MDE2499147.1 phosphoglycerate mutase [Alphaproteobacteria bacterium]